MIKFITWSKCCESMSKLSGFSIFITKTDKKVMAICFLAITGEMKKGFTCTVLSLLKEKKTKIYERT